MTVKVYFVDGRVEEYPNAYIYWEWGDDDERTDSGFRICAMDKNFNTAVAFVYPSECLKIEITSEECDRIFKSPPRENIIPVKRWKIFRGIHEECIRRDEKWGEQNHPLHRTGDKAIHILFKSMACEKKKVVDREAGAGNSNWANILLEEVYEAFAETEPEKQRKEMIQVAAVAVQIIECLDRRIEEAEREKGN